MISSPGDADSKEEEIRTQELRYLQDMFEGKLDPVVVHMIMNDCEFKGKKHSCLNMRKWGISLCT